MHHKFSKISICRYSMVIKKNVIYIYLNHSHLRIKNQQNRTNFQRCKLKKVRILKRNVEHRQIIMSRNIENESCRDCVAAA